MAVRKNNEMRGNTRIASVCDMGSFVTGFVIGFAGLSLVTVAASAEWTQSEVTSSRQLPVTNLQHRLEHRVTSVCRASSVFVAASAVLA